MSGESEERSKASSRKKSLVCGGPSRKGREGMERNTFYCLLIVTMIIEKLDHSVRLFMLFDSS